MASCGVLVVQAELVQCFLGAGRHQGGTCPALQGMGVLPPHLQYCKPDHEGRCSPGSAVGAVLVQGCNDCWL